MESEISEESTLYIAVCFESDFGNAVYLCDNEPLYVEFSTPGIALLHFFLLVNTWCNLSFFFSIPGLNWSYLIFLSIRMRSHLLTYFIFQNGTF